MRGDMAGCGSDLGAEGEGEGAGSTSLVSLRMGGATAQPCRGRVVRLSLEASYTGACSGTWKCFAWLVGTAGHDTTP